MKKEVYLVTTDLHDEIDYGDGCVGTFNGVFTEKQEAKDLAKKLATEYCIKFFDEIENRRAGGLKQAYFDFKENIINGSFLDDSDDYLKIPISNDVYILKNKNIFSVIFETDGFPKENILEVKKEDDEIKIRNAEDSYDIEDVTILVAPIQLNTRYDTVISHAYYME